MPFRRRLIAGLLAASVAGAACAMLPDTAEAQTRARATSRPAPPPLPDHALERPRARPGYVWMQGRWRWDRRQGQYVWAPGYWARDPRAIRHGVQGGSRFRGGQWQF